MASDEVTAAGRRVVIIGGGIGGLTTALGLQRLGIDFVVLEQAEALTQVGAGIQLSPNATHVLHWLGLEAPLAEVAVEPKGLDVRSYRSGERILWTPLGPAALEQFGAPYYHAHRADQLAVLVAALDMDKVRLSSQCVDFAQDAGGVSVVLADGDAVAGDVLIAADGVHSTVRGKLFGAQAPRRSSTGLRGLVAAEDVAGLEIDRVSGAWWGPGRNFVHYWVSGGRVLNWVGIVPFDEAAVESWSATGTVAETLRQFGDWHPKIVGMIQATKQPFKSAIYDRDALPHWVEGRIALLGDAAHPMLPHHAQGAAQCIEDAHVLARCLAEAPDTPEAALGRYQEIRHERVTWLQGYSRNADRHFQLSDPMAQRRRDRRLKERRDDFVNGFPPGQITIYGYNAVAEMDARA